MFHCPGMVRRHAFLYLNCQEAFFPLTLVLLSTDPSRVSGWGTIRSFPSHKAIFQTITWEKLWTIPSFPRQRSLHLWPCTCPWVVEIKRMVMTFNQQAAFRHLFNKDTSCTAQNPFNLESPQHMSLARTRLGVGSQINSISNTEQNGVSYVYFFLYRHSNSLIFLFPTPRATCICGVIYLSHAFTCFMIFSNLELKRVVGPLYIYQHGEVEHVWEGRH